MSCLSPIPESLGEYSQSSASASASAGHRSTSKPTAHRRNVSAFSSLNDLKSQMRQMSHQNQNFRLRVGGDVGSDCVMTAIPESHFMQKMGGPNEADMKLLGFSLPDISRDYEIRDEEQRKGTSYDQRTQVSVELPDNDIHEDQDSVGPPLEISPRCFDEVSEMATSLRASDRELGMKRSVSKRKLNMSFKKKNPLKKFAKKVWRKVGPFFYKSTQMFHKKEQPKLERSKGVLS